MQNATLQIGDWRLDPHANLVFNKQNSTQLEYKQVQLLLYLIARSGNTVSKDTLLSEIWAGRVVVEDVVAVAVSRLRKALNDRPRAPQYIKTIPGIGYQFIHPVSPQDTKLADQYYKGIIDYAEPNDNPVVPPNNLGGWLPTGKGGAVIFLTFAIACGVLAWANQHRVSIQAVLADQPTQGATDRAQKSFSSDALKKYQEARELRNSFAPPNTQKAAALLQEVIRSEPDFPDAYVLLAITKSDLLFQHPLIQYNASEELKALIGKALTLNPESSFAHETLGTVLLYVDWNFSEARHHFEKSLELDPNNAEAHHSYGLYLLALGQFAESYEHIQLARKLNPLNYSIASVAWIYAMQDRHQEAWMETEKLLTLQPNVLEYHRSALRLLENAGDEKKAYVHLRKILELADYSADLLTELDRVFAEDQLQGVYNWMAYEHPEERDIGFYPPPLSYARFAISAGRYDDAFVWLNEAFKKRQSLLLWLTVDPKYKPIRRDPRYRELLQRVGLPLPDQHQ